MEFQCDGDINNYYVIENFMKNFIKKNIKKLKNK